MEIGRIPLGMDATHAGSFARFVNDFRGILPRPNLLFNDWADQGTDGIPVRGIGLYSGPHSIPAGTELCVSYGKGFWQAQSS